MKVDYNKLMKEELNENTVKKSILLHSCCGPCSTAVIEKLKDYLNITIYYYNPNIEPLEEYEKRKKEQLKLLTKLNIDYIDTKYDNDFFQKEIFGLEEEAEGGARCFNCFELRLTQTAKEALENNFDYFGTTLTVSPHKNSQVINEIGLKIQNDLNIKFLVANFKKEEGYKRSLELAKQYDLYRQNYCGCKFSETSKQ